MALPEDYQSEEEYDESNGSPLADTDLSEEEKPENYQEVPTYETSEAFSSGSEYTTKEPSRGRTGGAESENKPEIEQPAQPSPKERVTAGQEVQQSLAPAAEPVTAKGKLANQANPGGLSTMTHTAEDAAKAGAATKSAATGDAFGAATTGAAAAIGKVAGDSETGQAIKEGAQVAADVTADALAIAAALEGEFLTLIKRLPDILKKLKSLRNGEALRALLKRSGKPLLIFGLLCCGSSLVLGITLGSILSPHGNAPGGIAIGGTYAGQTCAQLSSTLTTPDPTTGKTYTLTLAATSGYYSEEDNLQSLADPKPGYLFPRPGAATGQIGLWSELVANHKNEISTQATAQWYMTADWTFTATTFDGGQNNTDAVRQAFPGLPPRNAFAGKEVLIYNPKTNKGVVGFVGDWGPSPHEGIYPSSDVSAQRSIWNSPPGAVNNYRIVDPANFEGRVAGGGDAVTKALGNPDGTVKIQYGFAADQSMPLGPFTCTPIQNGAVAGSVPQPLNVPKVNEGSTGECGTASFYATILYYNPTYTSPNITVNSDGTATVKPNICSQLNAAVLSTSTLGKATDFVQARLQGNATGSGSGNLITWANIQQSLTSGDPIIMYTTPDPFLSSPRHIVVIRGYNASNDTYDVMSPNGTARYFDGTFSSGSLITATALSKVLNYDGGSNLGNEQFIIRKKYITPE